MNGLDDAHEQRIREIAYRLWQQEGSPAGRDVEFWQRARALAAGQDRIDEASEESFPASDPPAMGGITGPGYDS